MLVHCITELVLARWVPLFCPRVTIRYIQMIFGTDALLMVKIGGIYVGLCSGIGVLNSVTAEH